MSDNSDNNEKNNEDKEQRSQPKKGDGDTLETGILSKNIVARREMFRKQQNDNMDMLPPRHSLLLSTRNFKEAFNIDDISLSSDEETATIEEDEERFTFKKKLQGSSNRVLGNNSRPGLVTDSSSRRHSETLPAISKNKSIKGVDIEQASRPRHSFSFKAKRNRDNSVRLLESMDREKLKQRISLISSGNGSGAFDPEQPLKLTGHENNSMFWTIAAIALVLFFILVGIGILFQLSRGNVL